jgi:hypothetical protein
MVQLRHGQVCYIGSISPGHQDFSNHGWRGTVEAQKDGNIPMLARRIAKILNIGVITVTLTIVSVCYVAAEPRGLLETFFGIFVPPPPPATPSQLPTVLNANDFESSSTPMISITITPNASFGDGRIAGYCVRLCDGRYFQLPNIAGPNTTPAKMCSAMCPGTRTQIYWGSNINWSKASNGGRYTDLATAFNYRSQLDHDRDCTCNGKDVFGTAAISLDADLTLRPGDIVAMEDGFSVYVGPKSKSRSSSFIPVRASGTLSADVRKRLMSMRIATTPVAAPQAPQPNILSIQTRIILGFDLPYGRYYRRDIFLLDPLRDSHKVDIPDWLLAEGNFPAAH